MITKVYKTSQWPRFCRTTVLKKGDLTWKFWTTVLKRRRLVLRRRLDLRRWTWLNKILCMTIKFQLRIRRLDLSDNGLQKKKGKVCLQRNTEIHHWSESRITWYSSQRCSVMPFHELHQIHVTKIIIIRKNDFTLFSGNK